MEMERINENTIRVSIGNDDLAERGVTFLDLLGNQKQIESFFYSILEEVDVDEQFQETDSVTFQVLPNHDGLELFISKNLPMNDDDNLNMMQDNVLGDGFTDFLKEHIAGNGKLKEDVLDEEIDFLGESLNNVFETIFRLEDFETMITLAKNIQLQNVFSYLYKFKDEYFLRVSFFTEENNEAQVKNDMAQLYEYTSKTNVTTDILDEYGEVIMDRNALELTRYYFK
ncbi:adaptor protein MecA [Vagococcus carniphilus]|uniref:adaptor protein MecA n=1 Tax=Vagococcus carniphilus TaxID=218144 RepID=UPI002890D1F2|nr:adaptor protein MecA [Vagococcus carniphilus]MDT2816086.1 adaptor protein MecA [Vagococcus carniphilus]MDT2849619.1 adaptor protein MecA [Vagococcus carniphilus]MDT2866435.1 adaptor protein MecA [Vagococcus carniphilus]